MEQYDDLILEITALAMKANRVTNHDFFIDFSGHVNSINVYYIENGWVKDAHKNRITLLDIYLVATDHNFQQLEKCKCDLIAFIERGGNSGEFSNNVQI